MVWQWAMHTGSLTMYVPNTIYPHIHHSLTHSYIRTNFSCSRHAPPTLKQAHKQYWKWHEWRHNFQAASSKWPVSRTNIHRGHTIAYCTHYIHMYLKFSRATGNNFQLYVRMYYNDSQQKGETDNMYPYIAELVSTSHWAWTCWLNEMSDVKRSGSEAEWNNQPTSYNHASGICINLDVSDVRLSGSGRVKYSRTSLWRTLSGTSLWRTLSGTSLCLYACHHMQWGIL